MAMNLRSGDTQQQRYAAPAAELAEARESFATPSLQKVFTGRRLLVFCLLLLVVAFATQMVLAYVYAIRHPAPFAITGSSAVAVLAGLVVGPIIAIVGAFRLAGGLGHSMLVAFLFACLMVVPCANAVVMAWLVLRANRALAAAGHRVGVFGLR